MLIITTAQSDFNFFLAPKKYSLYNKSKKQSSQFVVFRKLLLANVLPDKMT